MQVVGNEYIESAVAGGVQQAFRCQFLQLVKTLDFRFPRNHPVAQELLDYLAIGAVLSAAPYRFQHAARHGMVRGEVFDGTVVGEFGEGGVHQALPASLDNLAVLAVADARHLIEVRFPSSLGVRQHQVAQGRNNVLALSLDDGVEVAQGKGLFGQRTHLRPRRRW